MPYTVSATEQSRKSASETETKALLYLMNFHDDRDEIHYFVVDVFNDLTGMDRYSKRLWDLQSKGAKNTSPKAVGKELVTLFKNFCSSFAFEQFILFLGGVSNTLRVDATQNIFDISNIKDSSLEKLKQGLKEECLEKTYIENSLVTDDRIEEFLDKVLFIVDYKPPREYVRAIIRIHPQIMPSDETLDGIFNEIRNMQSNKKDMHALEGITIQTTDQVLNLLRHLTNGEIKIFVLGRIINGNPFEKSCPQSFIPIYNQFAEERRRDALADCRLALSRALFNNNCADSFWRLFSNIYHTIVANPSYTIDEVYHQLDSSTMQECPFFDVLSLKYFISTVVEGIGL